MIARAAVLVAPLLALAAAPPSARAFRLAETYAENAELAGGGGRHFTGSLRDGYTCGVCHEGAERPEVELRGLPDDGYVPGEEYEIEIVLPDTVFAASLALDFTDEHGDQAGTVRLPDPAALDPAEMCDPVAGQPAAIAGHVVALPDGRSVVATDACGQIHARALWIAPAEPEGAVWLHAGVVGADGSNDPTGDGAAELARVIPVRGESAEAAHVAATCGVSGRARGALPAWAIAIAILIARRARQGR